MTRLQIPRAAAADIDSVALLEGEVVNDTTNDNLRLGDGATLGGKRLVDSATDVTISAAMAPVVQAATVLAGRDAFGVPRPGIVTMVHKTSQVWTVYLPDGEVLATPGTTTQGLQEAINWCDANAYPLIIQGGGVIDATADDPASRITCTTGLTIPPTWGNIYLFIGVDLFYMPSEATTTDFITIESADFGCMQFIGGEIVYSGDGAAIRFLPTTANGELDGASNPFIGLTSQKWIFPSIAIVDSSTYAPETTHGTGVRWTPGGNQMINCEFVFQEINGGERAFIVDTPTGSGAFRNNTIHMSAVHNNAQGGQIGQASTALIYGNKWCLDLNPGTGTALETFARKDTYNLSISSATTGVTFGSGSTGNVVIAAQNDASTPYSGAVAAQRIIDPDLVPVVTAYTSSSGTHTTTIGCRRMEIELIGGGGGGGGSGSGGSQTAGSNGGDTTFGSLTGGGGAGAPTSSLPGAGGTVSGGDFGIVGGRGQGGGTMPICGCIGGASIFGGAGPGGTQGQAGTAAQANSGAGGGSGSGNTSSTLAVPAGGSAGGYVRKTILGPSATYSYGVGAGGAAGAAGTGGFAGGAGAAGIIIVREFFD